MLKEKKGVEELQSGMKHIEWKFRSVFSHGKFLEDDDDDDDGDDDDDNDDEDGDDLN